MNIEAVIVCVGYADFLAETLPRTKRIVDDVVVVTSPADDATRALCCGQQVRCVRTDEFYARAARFNLAAGINVGLEQCRRDDWVLVLDADIALPTHTRDALETALLERAKLYGVDRMMAVGRSQWEAVRGIRQYKDHIVCAPAMRMGARVSLPAFGGYVPCGYFQLWNPAASGIHDFAVSPHGTCEESDMRQATRWHRDARVLLPEIIAIHLESAGATGAVGANWCGRTTPPF